MVTKRKRSRACVVAVVLGLLVTVGCGDDGGGGDNGKPDRPKEVTIDFVEQDGMTVHRKRIVLSGTVSPARATVSVKNKTVTSDAKGDFRIPVPLREIGENMIYLDARKPGWKSAHETLYVSRALTVAERAARAERRRQRREAALAELRASAEALDPELFQKDPDRYYGKKLIMTGEIFQIQEGGDNFLLMDTECSTEYDITICDGPTVYVSYSFPTDKTEEDLVTVYGVAQGGYEYETQIGGSNYVGWIEAKIIE
jgi:hypothetical protein